MTRSNPQNAPRHQLRAEKARRNREDVLAAFIAKKAEIDEKLARLQALSDGNFNCHPECLAGPQSEPSNISPAY